MGINILDGTDDTGNLGRVAIRPLADPDMIGSIIVPEMAKGRAVQGVVAMTSKSCQALKRGDHVFFPAHNGTVADIEDVRYIIMYEKDITCKLITEPLEVPGLFMETDGGYEPATEDFIIEMLHIHFEENYSDIIDKIKLDRRGFTK